MIRQGTVSQTAPFGYAVVYHCHCGCQPPTRHSDGVYPREDRMDDPAVQARVLATAERIADEYRRAGYLDVRVEPLYSTPDMGVN